MGAQKKRLPETFLLHAQNFCLIEEKKNPDNNHLGGYILLKEQLLFEQLISQNKTSSPEDFEFMRFDCITKYCPHNIHL